jgi:hypothetical protein
MVSKTYSAGICLIRANSGLLDNEGRYTIKINRCMHCCLRRADLQFVITNILLVHASLAFRPATSQRKGRLWDMTPAALSNVTCCSMGTTNSSPVLRTRKFASPLINRESSLSAIYATIPVNIFVRAGKRGYSTCCGTKCSLSKRTFICWTQRRKPSLPVVREH